MQFSQAHRDQTITTEDTNLRHSYISKTICTHLPSLAYNPTTAMDLKRKSAKALLSGLQQVSKTHLVTHSCLQEDGGKKAWQQAQTLYSERRKGEKKRAYDRFDL
jgi:photosystem II stability/assembly factor-like uncharacterized protein